MTVILPPEVEKFLLAAVRSGRFASVDEAMAEAARLLIRELSRKPVPQLANAGDESPDPLLGLMGDDVELMDEIVADAYRQRRQDTWRDVDL